MQKEFLIYIPYFIFGTIISVQDWKAKFIDLKYLILFFLSCLFIHFFERSFSFVIPLIFIGIGSIAFLMKNIKAFGFADYIMALSVSFIIKPDNWPEFLIFCGAIGILCSIIMKNKVFPLIPSMFLSSVFLL